MAVHYEGQANETRIGTPPEDGISCMRFTPSPVSNHLVCSSWDCSVRLYACSMATNASKHTLLYHHETPALSCTFLGEEHIASGSLDGEVKSYDLVKAVPRALGGHAKGVRAMDFCPELGLLSTGSWDGDVKLWDARVVGAAATMPQGERVYAMANCGPLMIVGTAGRKVLIWDLRKPAQPMQTRDSSLKYQTRCIAAFPDGSGYVLSSIEGRVAVEYLRETETQKKYAFKCHRHKNESGEEVIHPVNAVAFHPLYNTFATGGSDHLVNIWDPFNKKRLCQFHKYGAPIASIAFARNGQMMAIGCSYQYEQATEPIPMPRDEIYLRRVTDQESKPKTTS